MGVKYKTLVECKHYKSPISRDKVQLLFDKIRATGTHNGILISTSNFQSGAIKFASEHGIALIQLTSAMLDYEVRVSYNVVMNSVQDHYNYNKPYISVLQQSPEGRGITCAYLTAQNRKLGDFLLSMGSVYE